MVDSEFPFEQGEIEGAFGVHDLEVGQPTIHQLLMSLLMQVLFQIFECQAEDTLRGVFLDKTTQNLLQILVVPVNLIDNPHLQSFLGIVPTTVAKQPGSLRV